NLQTDNISKVQIGVDGNKKLLKDNKSDLSSDKSSKNDDFNFVKKIKKNNHPNKLYQMDSTIKNKFSIIKENLVQIDNKNININNNNNTNLTPFLSSDINDNLRSNKLFDKRTNSPGVNVNAHPISSNNSSHNQFSQNNSSEFLNNGYNSVLENLLDHLDLTQKGWTSKLASRIQNALINGGEEIEFNLKPKNLGVLKISLTLKQGIGQVKIITENSFTTNALQQNEALLQKLFNDQGINLDFTAHNGSQNSGSKNNSDHNEENSKDNKRNDSHLTEAGLENNGDEEINNSSRHIVNVIA
ncbi:flagellar hook-length control protein FliK, partial [Alphaproteobacteria bacterium]|nr:flagellar hook-length control protein FliK [Alphaproteobacteria bacterium]